MSCARESPVLLAAPVHGSELECSGSEDTGNPKEDAFKAPMVTDVRTGRVIELLVSGHCVWQLAPFNFEKYPGMRMNVSPEKMA
ncbi:unnamed protein product [Dicrocoelium dendriticum]|nr:unnamed protein product [Dicrocoelium dendriticum]